jgi:hypothetical protein
MPGTGIISSADILWMGSLSALSGSRLNQVGTISKTARLFPAVRNRHLHSTTSRRELQRATHEGGFCLVLPPERQPR